MTEDQEKRQLTIRVCPVCKGTGLDKTLHPRYTTGGHDDRSCPGCQGECYIEDESSASQYAEPTPIPAPVKRDHRWAVSMDMGWA